MCWIIFVYFINIFDKGFNYFIMLLQQRKKTSIQTVAD